jgi:hypothetical protein
MEFKVKEIEVLELKAVDKVLESNQEATERIQKELRADTDMKDLGERYEVVIECADENEQTALLLRLSQDGLKVRAIII